MIATLFVKLTDGRDLSIPLWWIPTLHHAAPEEREKYEVSRDRTTIIWHPARCAINDEVRPSDYLGPSTRERRLLEGMEPLLPALREKYPDLSDQEIIELALQELTLQR